MNARTGPNVKDIIRLADGLFVMLHHNHRITLIAQVFQRCQQPVIVALMQPDTGFIQDIKHPLQARTNLAGQTDALALAARQCAGVARKRQILKPHIVQESKPLADFLQNRPRNCEFLFAQLIRHALAPIEGFFDRHLYHLTCM